MADLADFDTNSKESKGKRKYSISSLMQAPWDQGVQVTQKCLFLQNNIFSNWLCQKRF